MIKTNNKNFFGMCIKLIIKFSYILIKIFSLPINQF